MNMTVKRVFIYLLGIPLIALGLVLLLKSELGLSSWSTLNYSVSQTFHISQGTANFLVASSITLLVTILEKKAKYLFIIILIFLVASTLDLLNDNILLADDYNMYYRTIFYVSGVIIMAAGSAMLVASTFPAGIYEEFMLLIMRAFKTNKMGFTRLCIEFTVVIIAIILGFISGFGFGGVNVGTLLISLFFGYILSFFLRIYKKLGF